MNFNPAAILSLVVSLSVFFLSALALIVPSGYTYGALVLLLISLIYLWVRPYPPLTQQDYFLILALLFYFVVGAATNFFHHLPHNSYDNFSRFLLAIPVFLLLARIAVKPIHCWLGIATGAIGAGVMACWDFYSSHDRADGFTNAIQFGDIAIIFSCMLLVALPWARAQSKVIYVWVILGIIGGFVASILSESRGGWLVLPAVITLLYWCGNYRTPRHTLLLVGFIAILIGGVYFVPAFEFIRERFTDFFVELHGYQSNQIMDTSVGARIHMWKISLVMIEQRPLLGWGSLANYLTETGVQDAVLADFNHVHNDFLDACVKRGLFGVIALSAIYMLPLAGFCRALNAPNKKNRSAAMAGVVLVIGTFVCGLTQTFFAHSSGVMIYVFILVILWAQARTSLQKSK